MVAGTSIKEVVTVQPSSKAQSAENSTNPGPSSQSSQSPESSKSSQPSPSPSSNSPVSTSTGPSPSDSASNSHVASSSGPSPSLIPLASSTPSDTLSISSALNVPTNPSTTVATITSSLPSQTPSQSGSSRQASTAGGALFRNKPAMIAVFTSIGVFVIVVILIFGIFMVRRTRRKDTLEGAFDFTQHAIDNSNHNRGGSSSSNAPLIPRSSDDSLPSESRSTRSRVQDIGLGASPSVPVPTVSVPASVHTGEMQQRRPETGYIIDRWLDRGLRSDATVTYESGNSSRPSYEVLRQQRPPPPPAQQHQPQRQLQYQSERPPRPPPPQHLQRRQEERPLPQNLPANVAPIPSSLMPSSQYDTAVFNVPFAVTGTKPLRLGTDGGLGGVDRTRGSRPGMSERRQTPSRRFSRNIPGSLGRNNENMGLDNRSLVLKVINE